MKHMGAARKRRAVLRSRGNANWKCVVGGGKFVSGAVEASWWRRSDVVEPYFVSPFEGK